jgi:haloacetate dehalogenase
VENGEVLVASPEASMRFTMIANLQDNADASVRIVCPVMWLWGHDFKSVGEMFDMSRVWAEMASNVVTHAIPECGHLPHEEKPAEINRRLIDFLAGWKG